MARCMASWTQQAWLSGSKQQLQSFHNDKWGLNCINLLMLVVRIWYKIVLLGRRSKDLVDASTKMFNEEDFFLQKILLIDRSVYYA